MAKITLTFIRTIFFIILFSQATLAQNLPLNGDEFSRIQRSCPECIENNVMVCGNQDIGFGKKFYGNFFQGMPSRGFLITPPILASNFKALVRTERDYQNLKRIVYDEFSTLKLIVVSPSFEAIQILADPKVDVIIPQPLHDCLIIKNNTWGCGVSTDNNGHECCEKRLGSPIIKVTWMDSINQERIELQYNPDLGSTKLIRVDKNNTKVIYYCQNSEPATLRLKP